MQTRIVLISDDDDFFEYISPKLKLRKSDELYRFCFDDIPERVHLLTSSLIFINSEKSEEQTIELLKLIKDTPAIIFSFDENEKFKIECYKEGAIGFINLMTGDEELEAMLVSALNILSSLEKKSFYHEILVKDSILSKNNEVFINYTEILDKEIKRINETSENAVLAAISPSDKTKFLVNPNQIETIILNNIRKNDILMNYAPNKYFLLLYNSNLDSAKIIWEKIRSNISEKIYAGFIQITHTNRQQAVNEVLNKLHENINKEYLQNNKQDIPSENNFKFVRQEFFKRFDKTVTPVFYHTQQTYNNKLFGINIEQETGDGYGNLYIKSRYSSGIFKITSPGQSKINIDIIYKSNNTNPEKNFSQYPQAKRITIEPDEFEAGLLEDLLEQFITEFKNEVANDGIKQ